jgi:hypothetical protein
MEPLWMSVVQWLHTMGIHLSTPKGAAEPVTGAAAQAVGAGMDLPGLLALAAALGWASGFRLYAVVFLVGLAGSAGWIALPPGLAVLQHPALLIGSGVMLFAEFFADKIPGVDSLWDLLHSVVRIPAGAALAAGALGADSATTATLAALLGGTLAATSQAAKTTTRAAINTSPEPFSNLLASLAEDGLVVLTVWLATTHPLLFGVLLVLAVLLAWVVTALLFQFLRAVFRRVSVFLSGSPKAV